jgi:hypothetical protein
MAAAASVPAISRTRGNFFAVMALAIVGIVAFGFSFTFVDNLIHPAYPRPAILYIHAVIFSSWLALFVAQVGLIRTGQVATHRRLGTIGIGLGAVMPVVGVATAIAMTRLRVAHGEMDAAGSFLIPCWDMLGFTTTFALAIRWRRRPDFHRRLMYMATAILTAAAWGRMPFLDHAEWFYSGVDLLIAIAALRDLLVDRRIHVVYLLGLPALICGQFLLAAARWSDWWLATAPGLFR